MIKTKKLMKEAKIPTKAHSDDAGYDLYSAEDTVILAGDVRAVSTGVAIQLPDMGKKGFDLYGRVAGRSSLAVKHSIAVFGGVCDRGYTGEIKACLYNGGKEAYLIKKGDRIAQYIPTVMYNLPITETVKFTKTNRGKKGFGSTGK